MRYVDDGLATSVSPTIAALDVVDDEPVALIVGGFDRGVDDAPLAAAIVARVGPTTVVTLGPAGERIAAALRAAAAGVEVTSADSMRDAVARARGRSRTGASSSSRPRRRVSTGIATGRSARRTSRPSRARRPRGAWEEIRTPDLRITNALLYRLSYPGATNSYPIPRRRSQPSEREHQVRQHERLVDVRSTRPFVSAIGLERRGCTRPRARARGVPRALPLERGAPCGRGRPRHDAEPESQFLEAKASLLALELRVDLRRLPTERWPTSLASGRAASSSACIRSRGAIAASRAAAISVAIGIATAAVPLSRSGTERHVARRARDRGRASSTRARARLPRAERAAAAATSGVAPSRRRPLEVGLVMAWN